jgi:hypothetical protein
MSTDKLEALAVRCEQATGPDFDLSQAIFDMLVTNGFVPDRSHLPYPGYHFTGSLDAAWTLLPDDDITLCKEGADDWVADLTCLAPDGWTQEQQWTLYVRGKTPALALCAAALRAQATSPGKQ